MTIDEIVNYVMLTPENVNPAILRQMIYQYGEEQGGGSYRPASKDTIGAVMIGDGLDITSAGVVSAAVHVDTLIQEDTDPEVIFYGGSATEV